MELLASSMTWPNILVALFILLMAAAAHVKKTKGRKMAPLPPGPWQFPILGNFHNLAGSELPHRRLAELSKEYGPLMRLQLGQILTVVVSSRDAARAVMKTHDLNFADRPSLLAAREIMYNSRDVGMAPYGEYWRTMKKVCTMELLTARRVATFRHLRDAAVSRVMDSLGRAGVEPVNLSKQFLFVSNFTVSHATFGNTNTKHSLDDVVAIMSEIVNLGSGMNLADFFPTFELLISIATGFRSKLRGTLLKMEGVLEDIIKEHMSRDVNKKDEDKDLVDLLLSHYQLQDFDFPISINDIKAVVLDMFIGGTDTSSSTLEWAMAELMKNPDVMHRAQSEVRHMYQQKGKIDESIIDELHYLKLVIKETLRLHPPLPLLLPRLSREACELQGYQIPAKTRVIVNAWALGRDPESWVKPNEFNPERFGDQSLDFKGTSYEYLPFGAGRRMCPGITFGLANVEITLAKILCHFNWKLPNGIGPQELNMEETSGAAIRRKFPLCVVPTTVIPF